MNAMQRRAFLGLVGASAIMAASSTNAQQATRVRTIGVLMGVAKDEETKARSAVIEKGLAKRGWIVGENLRLEYRFGGAESERLLALAKELVSLKPDVIIGHSTPAVMALHVATETIPIVFVVVGDPVGSGLVRSIARPGGNITGFSVMWPTITGKYLSLLKDLKANLSRVALMYNQDSASNGAILALAARTFKESAGEFHVDPIIAEVQSPAEIERTITDLAGAPPSALMVMPGNFTTLNRTQIISLAARFSVPALYPYRYFVDEGGLMSYGIDVLDLFRRAPDYVDRILRGANPADLPVQAPRKFELVINLKTAQALGIVVPRILLAGADALIN
jgi:putative tryptophan/tyrosine transport system substrate-binding protein